MHPVPVELDLVQPLRPVRRGFDQFGELRLYPTRQRCRFGAHPSCRRSRHLGISGDRWDQTCIASFAC
jgi:hypothetical protein